MRLTFLRLMLALVVCCTLFIHTSAAIEAAPAAPRATIDAALRARAPDIAVPVIMTLRGAAPRTEELVSTREIEAAAARMNGVRAALLQRHPGIVRIVKNQPRVAPVLFAVLEPQALDALASDPAIEAIQLDARSKPALYESTGIIGSTTANTAGYTGAGTAVAVLDTGVLSSHEFLSGQVVAQACFSTTNSGQHSTSVCPGGAAQAFGVGAGEPCAHHCDHGTHVAGIIAGKQTTYGGRTFSGVAPGAKIIAVQVFSEFAQSECGVGATDVCVMSFSSDQIMALDWLYTNRVTAGWGNLASINMSLGGGSYATLASCASDPLTSSVNLLRAAGVATVIASGNDSLTSAIASPACISSAIAVGASTSARSGTLDAPASFSNRPSAANNAPNAQGDRLLDLMAPGNEIMSSIAATTRSYEDYPGTSMATPHVAGAWAVLKGIVPGASVTQVLGWLRTTGKSIVDTRNGDPLTIPRIDVGAAAVRAAADAAVTPSVTATRTISPTKTRTATRTATRNPKQSATKTRTKTRTSTRTRTATTTHIPTTTPSATPLPAWATSLTNGNFEQGRAQTVWTESSSQGYQLISLTDTIYAPRGGIWFAWLGGDNNETSTLSRTITVPAEASYLRLYTFMLSKETNCANDTATVKLNNVMVATIPLCYATNTTEGYIPFSIDVSALRGQTGVPFEIKVVTNGTIISHFLIDDVGYVSQPTDSIYRIPFAPLSFRNMPGFARGRPTP